MLIVENLQNTGNNKAEKKITSDSTIKYRAVVFKMEK